MSPSNRSRYVFEYPRVAMPVFRRQVFWWCVVLLVTAAVVWGCLEALWSPPPRGWRTVAGVVLGIFAIGSVLDLVHGLGSRFGLRIVPRFQPPLPDWPDTYSHGRALIRQTQVFDQRVAAMNLKPLIGFGLEPGSTSGWFDCGELRKTVAALLAGEGPDRPASGPTADLRRIDAALAVGESAGSRVRLEIAGGDGMNGMFWEYLRREGY